jgi:hypothetical protein
MGKHRNLIGLAVLLTLIVGAHVALWSSDTMPVDLKRRLTIINAIGWGVVLFPAFGVAMWLRHRGRR